MKEKFIEVLKDERIVDEITDMYVSIKENLVYKNSNGNARYYILINTEGKISKYWTEGRINECIIDDILVVTEIEDDFDEEDVLADLSIEKYLSDEEIEEFKIWCEKYYLEPTAKNYKSYNEDQYEYIIQEWWREFVEDYAADEIRNEIDMTISWLENEV